MARVGGVEGGGEPKRGQELEEWRVEKERGVRVEEWRMEKERGGKSGGVEDGGKREWKSGDNASLA